MYEWCVSLPSQTTQEPNGQILQGQFVGDLTTGIGAGSDSFYEYLLKSYILFGDPEYLDMFNKVIGRPVYTFISKRDPLMKNL